MTNQSERTVLFFRRVPTLRGAHLKVFDYFNHVNATPGFRSAITFDDDSTWSVDNPWWAQRNQTVADWRSLQADIWFLSGHDWRRFTEQERTDRSIRKICLVQAMHHTEPEHAKYQYLRYRAIWICVSEEIRDRLAAGGAVNGPLFLIPNTIDRTLIPDPIDECDKSLDLLVVALKDPEAGKALFGRLASFAGRIELLDRFVSRDDFLRRIGQARTVVFLPKPTEGFYLPPLEAMEMGSLVVCPDCQGNRSFCIPDYNCLRPAFTIDDLCRSVEQALALPPEARARLIANGHVTVEQHDLIDERRSFQKILTDVDQLWG
jgi:Glycosyl transferases group 1